jgi:uncharacterized protein (DUF433 family)
MARIHWKYRFVLDPEIHHGEAWVRGTRVPGRVIVASLADGRSSDDIRRAYPQRDPEDVQAALAYAADVLHEDVLVPLASG